MTFNIVTIFSNSERSQLKKAFQANQKKKALLATPTYCSKYPPGAKRPKYKEPKFEPKLKTKLDASK